MSVAGDDYPATFARLTSSPSDSTVALPAAGLLFGRLLQQAVATDPHPYRELTTTSVDHDLGRRPCLGCAPRPLQHGQTRSGHYGLVFERPYFGASVA
jgi:hypothetical protein